MTRQTETVIELKCSTARLWHLLGWKQSKHRFKLSPEPLPLQVTSLVTAPWALERRPLKFRLICGDEE